MYRNALISIHAPARGATGLRKINKKVFLYFNPRAREGRDPSVRVALSTEFDFNPRAREGRDFN